MKKETTILVTGGAGYIGSHFIHALRELPEAAIAVVDNFCQSRHNIMSHPRIVYHQADLRDRQGLIEIFQQVRPNIVAHFAALASVPESVAKPFEYYQTNLVGGLNLLEAMKSSGTNKIIFSSSAAVYGEPEAEVIREDHPKQPTNPYGYTKLAFERMLEDFHRAYGLNSISFRYFCAAGCNAGLEIGEYHQPETHVIPCIVQTLLGQRENFSVFGNDYATPDGTGIRDYIHVDDLASAHLLAMKKLMGGDSICSQYNLGINKGFSVMELIRAAEAVSGKKLAYNIQPRRPGDPSRLIADASAARADLGWRPDFTDIREIVQTSYLSFSQRS